MPYDSRLPGRSARAPRRLAEGGLPAVLAQTLRAIVHSRMELGMQRYQREFPGADVVLFEPNRHDHEMFFTNIFSYASRRRLAEHAYQKTRKELFERRHELEPVLARHGIALRLEAITDPDRHLVRRARPRPPLVAGTRVAARLADTLDDLGALARARGVVGPRAACYSSRPAEERSKRAAWSASRSAARASASSRRACGSSTTSASRTSPPTVIADEMDISPGNLYYHFRSKDEIVEHAVRAFEQRDRGRARRRRAPRGANVEDLWLFLHLLFEAIWRYRFLYRDLNDLLSRNRLLEVHFKRLLERKVEVGDRAMRRPGRARAR